MDILLGALGGIALTVAAAVVVYAFINKSNIAEKIKELFRRKRPDIDPKVLLHAFIKQKIDNGGTVDVDVFFGNEKEPEIEKVTLVADKIDDDIREGDWINLDDDIIANIDDDIIIDIDDSPIIDLSTV